MDQPTTARQQQHRNAVPISSAADAVDFPSQQQQQTKQKPLTIHTPPPSHFLPHTRPTTTTNEAKSRRSSSISSQTSSIHSQGGNGIVSSSSSPFLPASPLFRTGYNKLGGSTVGMGTVVGSMSGPIGVGVGGSFSPYLGQRSPYGTSPGRRGLSSSTLSLLSSHPSSPGVPPAQGAFFTTEIKMPFDMEAIDVSESEGEQDVLASIDGDDESESSGSEEGDDDDLNISDKDDGDNDDQEDSGVESPLSTYDPIPAASVLSSSASSPSMMTGRLGLYGGVPQTHNGDILRRSREIERNGSFSLQDLSLSHDQRKGTDLVLDVQATTTTAPVENEQEMPWTASEQDNHDSEVEDAPSLGFAPSPTLSHSTPAYSAQSTTPSSPSLSVSPYPLKSEHIPDSRLSHALSSSSTVDDYIIPDTLDGANETSERLSAEPAPTSLLLTPLDSRAPISALSIGQCTTPFSPLREQNDEQEDNIEPYLSAAKAEVDHQSAEDLIDEGVFEDEEVRCHHSRSDSGKTQDADIQRTIEVESHPDGYGSLPKYSTHPTPAIVQQQHNDTALDHSLSSSTSDAVVAELKEVRTMLQDVHKRMDRLERTLLASPPPVSGLHKDNSSHSVPKRRGGIMSIIKSVAGAPRRGGGGGGRLFRIAIFVLFVGLIVFGGRRRRPRRNMRLLLGMDWAAAKQLARSRLGFLERRVSRLRLH